MCTPTAVCVDNDYAASEATISLRTANDECGHRTRSRPFCHLSTLFLRAYSDDLFDDRVVHLVHARSNLVPTLSKAKACSSQIGEANGTSTQRI